MDDNLPKMVTSGRQLGAQNHDKVGGNYLENLGFPSLVCNIVGGHVNAKRYLVFKNKEYYKKLSETSKETLEHQGGMMTPGEAEEFEQSDTFDVIFQMRTWDERAKDTTAKLKTLDYYKQLCLKVLNSQQCTSK